MRPQSTLSLTSEKDRLRFWTKVDRSGDCWPWLAARARSGHGWFRLHGRMHPAHRVAYANEVGPIPDGLEIHHRCGNPGCVNPEHLEPLTKADHSRLNPIVAAQAAQTACKRGHAFTEDNTYVWRGMRHCRTCHAARQRGRKRRQTR